jgi:thioredoxin reductase
MPTYKLSFNVTEAQLPVVLGVMAKEVTDFQIHELTGGVISTTVSMAELSKPETHKQTPGKTEGRFVTLRDRIETEIHNRTPGKNSGYSVRSTENSVLRRALEAAFAIGDVIDTKRGKAVLAAAGWCSASLSAFMTHAVRNGYYERTKPYGEWRRLK